ncbi:MAG: RNA degradosome polyphosphate kinase, partial [Amylibacter sp.]
MVDADYLKKTSVPAPFLDLEYCDGPDRFFNRELSWLAFNARVLEVSENDQIPVLERLRMLSISAKNLDEFFVVRVAGLERLISSENFNPTLDGRTPEKQLVEM